jgi:hypothetical protein
MKANSPAVASCLASRDMPLLRRLPSWSKSQASRLPNVASPRQPGVTSATDRLLVGARLKRGVGSSSRDLARSRKTPMNARQSGADDVPLGTWPRRCIRPPPKRERALAPATVGAIVASHSTRDAFAFGAAIFVLGLLRPLTPYDLSGYRFGAVTLAIVLLVPRTEPAWRIAWHRLAEVSIGLGVAPIWALVWPERETPTFRKG